MKRTSTSGKGRFARFGLRANAGRTNKTFRGGVRQ